MAANFRRPTKPSEAVETARQFLEALRFIEKQREADTELLELERMWELK